MELVRNIRNSPLMLGIMISGLAVHLVFFMSLKVAPARGSETEFSTAFVTYGGPAGADMLINDPEPLYLPTSLNTSALFEHTDVATEATPLFTDYPAELALGEEQLRTSGMRMEITTDVTVDTWSAINWSLVEHYGATRPEPAALPMRWATLYVESMTSEGSAYSPIADNFTEDVPPFVVGRLWSPAVFLLLIEDAGNLGFPVLAESTGIEELDAYFRESIGNSPTATALPAGYYRITIGP